MVCKLNWNPCYGTWLELMLVRILFSSWWLSGEEGCVAHTPVSPCPWSLKGYELGGRDILTPHRSPLCPETSHLICPEAKTDTSCWTLLGNAQDLSVDLLWIKEREGLGAEITAISGVRHWKSRESLSIKKSRHDLKSGWGVIKSSSLEEEMRYVGKAQMQSEVMTLPTMDFWDYTKYPKQSLMKRKSQVH